jgi:hypothetical protein
MELNINLTTIQENSLTPTFYCYLVCLYTKTQFPWDITDNQLKILEDLGFIKLTVDGPIIKPLFQQKFKSHLSYLEVESWIEDWRNLFPSKVEISGRPVKGSKQGCLKKMKVYLKNNPSVSKEEIFEATRIYIWKKKREDYNFMTSADYFIEKNNVSLLDALVEQYREVPNTLQELEQGNNPFMKQI